MHFCNKCGNMYYITLNTKKTNSISYYCRKCGNKDDTLLQSVDNLCVSKTHITKKYNKSEQIINEYTKLDPTLPKMFNMKCPNTSCKGHKSKNNNIIYIRYDDNNMKYLYLCKDCDTSWKTD